MQLFKPFSMDQPPIFTDNHLRQHNSPNPNSQVKQVQRVANANGSCVGNDEQIDQIRQNQFYQQYKKIFTVAYHLYLEKQRLAHLHQDLNRQINVMSERLKNSSEKQIKKIQNYSQENRAKRSRRTAEMIEKRFKCDVQFCERLYGSQGSLQQHIKLKHPQLYNNPDRLSHCEEDSSSC